MAFVSHKACEDVHTQRKLSVDIEPIPKSLKLLLQAFNRSFPSVKNFMNLIEGDETSNLDQIFQCLSQKESITLKSFG